MVGLRDARTHNLVPCEHVPSTKAAQGFWAIADDNVDGFAEVCADALFTLASAQGSQLINEGACRCCS